ncbi:MAG: glutamate--cysteine ligase [Alphaproteobacteria bacterium]|nr:MAG: glutamate--cysteine ligase [Alphaproteobacteria bacterium]
MGEEIESSAFTDEDFAEFDRHLKIETALLENWFQAERFYAGAHEGGLELEAWLVDPEGHPAPRNKEFLSALNNPLVVPELSKFNIEFNTAPQALNANALSQMETDLQHTWDLASARADSLGLGIVMIGILPAIRESDLTMANMSGWQRYKALNEQIFAMREGKPINLKIEGREKLATTHYDVMLEAGATSFQVHLKVNQRSAARYYNASKLVSGPLVAVAANSPYLFGRDLWDETRIPLFEQAISVDEWDYAERVTFGVRYLDKCLSEVFVANRQRYPALLPRNSEDAPEKLAHLKLHNGTIWRWNRALLGNEPDGTPHLRIEHRTLPAGPTIQDCMANAAFYFGLVEMLAHEVEPPEHDIPFRHCRNNFYACAKTGLQADLVWRGGKRVKARALILEELVPLAREGLTRLEISPDDIERYLGIIEARARTGRTGANWQRAWVETHSRDMSELTLAYQDRQNCGLPVHEWSVT